MNKYCIFVILIMLLPSCKREKACTEEFRMLTVTVKNQDNTPLVPDAYYLVRTANSDTLFTHNNNPYNEPMIEGIVIFTDNEMNYTNNEGGELFKFTAYKDSLQVVDEAYRIKHDDCHFELVSGRTEFVL